MQILDPIDQAARRATTNPNLGLMMDAWASFFIAQAGASAALLGLLFVGVSLNLAKILSVAYLPDRALIAMILLFTVLIMSSLLLIPGQSDAVMGVEVFCLGLATWLGGTILEFRGFRSSGGGGKAKFLANLLLFEAATIPYGIAGVALILGQPAAIYWLAVAIIISLTKAVTDAWVLLIEINR